MENIKRVLKEKGVSMSELARRMGVTYSAVKTQLSSRQCTMGYLHRISQALDVPVYELLMPDNKMGVDAVQEVEPAVVCPHCVNPIVIDVNQIQVEIVQEEVGDE